MDQGRIQRKDGQEGGGSDLGAQRDRAHKGKSQKGAQENNDCKPPRSRRCSLPRFQKVSAIATPQALLLLLYNRASGVLTTVFLSSTHHRSEVKEAKDPLDKVVTR